MQKTILYGNQIQISEPLLITEENAFLTENSTVAMRSSIIISNQKRKKIHKLFLS